MFRKLVLTTAIAAYSTASVAAPVAAPRTPAPISAEAEAFGGNASGILWPVLIAAAIGLIILLTFDDEDDPVSP
jgi:hypothetical protein